MTEICFIEDITYKKETVLTVGTFDGIHQGHISLMKRLVQKAKQHNCRSVVVSFDPHPRSIIHAGDEGIRLLTTLEERSKHLSELGVDVLCVIPFTRDFSLQNSKEFVTNILSAKIGLSHFIIGYDHHFGKNRDGNAQTLQKISTQLNFDVEIVDKKEMGDLTISSTKIRQSLEIYGNAMQAEKFLGRPYSFEGVVVHGDERGRTIGFPTANIQLSHRDKLIPREGIYAVLVQLQGKTYHGMMNIGNRPTFNGQNQRIEVHLFSFNEQIYGQTLRVFLIDRIRDEQKFTGSDELVSQLKLDRKKSLEILAGRSI
jgi:riboflavin kinase / FMN adenylyltransferase